MAKKEETREESGRTLGLERWVQFGFIGGAMLAFWFLDHLFADVAAFAAEQLNMADPNPTLVTAAAAILSILGAWMAYRNPKWNKFTFEVASELSAVTWPTRQETWSNTLVVLVVSAIAAVILGVFDFAWSNVTDLIY